MSIQITHVRFGGTRKTEDEIVSYKWKSEQTGEVKQSDKSTLVAWIDDGGKAYVGVGSSRVSVGVVRPQSGQPFLRTYADGKWTNNLVSLPTF
ncbi:hypothetical protein A9Z40_01935 [Microbacterium arborescens]|uniref:DUF3892 domain-containing protein n=1 Tax=Microbacterium arborescens TaxID=33883 RepID=A0ABX2WJ93_9MICO|nr:DUF3892 domain-containing protein [Microbacterium arborescens]OAZ41479.1 hypothetical protein A9Z40_01935 [Microbacterium arborescens]